MVITTNCINIHGGGGLNPVNNYTEFVGLSLEEQRHKIREGYQKLLEAGIPTAIFVAPSHTFDENTLRALREETDIRIISDTIANDVYFKDEFYYIPQQSGVVRNLPFRLTTFCYHPNTMTDEQFTELEAFLIKQKERFISFDNVNLKNRKKSLFDKALSFLYFHK